jgi:RNA polymerase sigma-70 factor (ECF subfamily)
MHTETNPLTAPEKHAAVPDVEELFTLYADDVLRVCSVYLGRRSLAEDAFQDVFCKVCTKADTYRGDTPVKYWLLAIARNVCRDYLRSTWLSRVISYDEWTERKPSEDTGNGRRRIRDGSREENAVISRADSGTSPLMTAVLKLPPRYKDVILLRYYYDLDNDEIARTLNIAESSVRSRLFRARKKLSAFMEGE